MNDTLLFSLVYVLGAFVAACAQILLKKSAGIAYKSRLREYLNIYVVSAYGIVVISMLMTTFSFRGIPLSMGPVLGAAEYIFVAVLDRLFLKERVSRRRLLGLAVIVLGIVIYSL